MAEEKKETEERAKFRRIGCGFKEYGEGGPLPHPSVQCDFFAEFMRRRFPGEKDESYILEWAERFRKGEEFQHADSESRQVLLDVMLEGPGDGTASHIDKKDVQTFCKRLKELTD